MSDMQVPYSSDQFQLVATRLIGRIANQATYAIRKLTGSFGEWQLTYVWVAISHTGSLAWSEYHATSVPNNTPPGPKCFTVAQQVYVKSWMLEDAERNITVARTGTAPLNDLVKDVAWANVNLSKLVTSNHVVFELSSLIRTTISYVAQLIDMYESTSHESIELGSAQIKTYVADRDASLAVVQQVKESVSASKTMMQYEIDRIRAEQQTLKDLIDRHSAVFEERAALALERDQHRIETVERVQRAEIRGLDADKKCLDAMQTLERVRSEIIEREILERNLDQREQKLRENTEALAQQKADADRVATELAAERAALTQREQSCRAQEVANETQKRTLGMVQTKLKTDRATLEEYYRVQCNLDVDRILA